MGIGCSFETQKKSCNINAFQRVLNESRYKPDKILVDKESKFYNSSMKSWLQDSDIEKYSTYNKEKSVVTKTFIRTLKEQTLQLYGFNI